MVHAPPICFHQRRFLSLPIMVHAPPICFHQRCFLVHRFCGRINIGNPLARLHHLLIDPDIVGCSASLLISVESPAVGEVPGEREGVGDDDLKI
jgi:hypothetical protein